MPKEENTTPQDSDKSALNGAEATPTSSPDVTDGASSSDAAVETKEVSFEDHQRAEFLKEYGDPTKDEGEKPDDKPEEQGEVIKAEEKSPDDDKTVREDAPVANKDDGADETFRLSDDEFKNSSDGVRKRIGYLSTTVAKVTKKLDDANTELSVTRESHERLTPLTNFVRENHIPPESVTFAFEMSRLHAAGEYGQLLEALKPLIDQARQATGETIAPELQKRIEDGYLSEDDAKAIGRARGETAAAQVATARAQAQVTALTAQGNQATATQEIVHAVTAREAELKAADPDYAKIEDAVGRQLSALLGFSQPANTEDAILMVNKAYEMAKAGYVQQKPKSNTMPTPSASTVSRGTAPVPATFDEAIKQSMENFVAPAS